MRKGIIRMDGKFLAQIMRLPGHTVEDVQKRFETGAFEFVISGDRMPEHCHGEQMQSAEAMWGETVCDSITRVWRAVFVLNADE